MFTCHRWDNTRTAHRYLCGLVQAETRNMERMEEAVPGTDYEAVQQFISKSPWDARAVMDRVALKASGLLGGTGMTALVIDETAFAKKGRASVGVARQWNGRLGKTDNCQVPVFAALSAGNRAVPVAAELFLPREWTDDPARCRRAGVPEERICHKTKPDLAVEMVRRLRALGVEFDYSAADGLYGNSGWARALDNDGEIFIVHVHRDQAVWLENPEPAVPAGRGARGRAPEKPRARTEPLRADAYAERLTSGDFARVVAREAADGPLERLVHSVPVWVWDGEEKAARHWTLVVLREVSSGDVKYCLTNAPKGTPPEILAAMEAQRFFIERGFEDAKKEAGMAEYQVRGWLAWNHHIALVMLAMLFMTRQRMLRKDAYPLLSCHDIKVLLAAFLPKRAATVEDVFSQMVRRHAKRRKASENACARRRRRMERPTDPLREN